MKSTLLRRILSPWDPCAILGSSDTSRSLAAGLILGVPLFLRTSTLCTVIPSVTKFHTNIVHCSQLYIQFEVHRIKVSENLTELTNNSLQDARTEISIPLKASRRRNEIIHRRTKRSRARFPPPLSSRINSRYRFPCNQKTRGERRRGALNRFPWERRETVGEREKKRRKSDAREC